MPGKHVLLVVVPSCFCLLVRYRHACTGVVMCMCVCVRACLLFMLAVISVCIALALATFPTLMNLWDFPERGTAETLLKVEKEGKQFYVDFQEALGSAHGRVNVKAMSPEIKAVPPRGLGLPSRTRLYQLAVPQEVETALS